ncbi:MAG TPA: dUTP diphosphatase [Firmicutes bacterium]|nr:dUTP diphosphatase [Bacillota bacterium]
MNNLNIKIKLLRPNASIPVYATDGAAAADLCAALDEPVVLNPSERRLIPTGIAIAPDDTINGSRDVDDSSRDTVDSSRGTVDSASGASFAAIICARSGLASRRGLALANGIGVVDADYRGEIMVSMINLGNEPVTIEPGERIAQLMFVPILHAEFIQSEVLPETARQAGGFGSTGTK